MIIGTKQSNERKDRSITNVRLDSDFRDYYDHWFSPYGQDIRVLLRRMNSGPSRFGALFILDTFYNVPPFDIAEQADFVPDTHSVVLHFQEGHVGTGKVITPLRDARIAAPDKLVVKYYSEARGKSKRLLSVGKQKFYFSYESNYWRSNYGTLAIDMIPQFCYSYQEVDELFPLYAIDFIETKEGLMAIDLNVSPSLKELDGIISPRLVVEWISDAVTPKSVTVLKEG